MSKSTAGDSWPIGVDTMLLLSQLPVLTKDDVRSYGGLVKPVVRRSLRDRIVTTSGTSGQPLELRVEYAASAREWAFMLWHWRRAGFPEGGRRAVLRGQYVVQRSQGQYWYDDAATSARVFSSADLSEANVAEYAVGLSEFRPDALHAYPSTALQLTRLMRSAGLRPPSLKVVLLGSEGMLPGEREELEAFFNCKVFTWYGHTEKCVLAYESDEPGLLVPEWLYGFVELVDQNGDPILEEGVPGRIVGTGFTNHATTLLRYATDDWACWAVSPRQAGLRGARLGALVPHRGRDTLLAHDGSEISVTYLHGAHEEVLSDVYEMQYVQLAPGRMRVDVVLRSSHSADALRRIEAMFQSRLDGRLTVEAQEVHELVRAPNGKRVLVRSV